MGGPPGAAIIERGLFDPAKVDEATVYAAWACAVATLYLLIYAKYGSGMSCAVLSMRCSIVHHLPVEMSLNRALHKVSVLLTAGGRAWLLLTLGLVMPSYSLRYVFFGTRWGSNSSFAMVNLFFTSLCPAKMLLPCPDSDPLQLQFAISQATQTPCISPCATQRLSPSQISAY